jgi:hypothetical protein
MKSMKKRLLITSIVMMLVVAVALSTATYAWFTSNVSVTANSVTMTAGTSTSSALGIQWTAGTSGPGFNANYTTDIDSVAPASTISGRTEGFQPAAPVALDIATAPVFKTAFINAQDAFQAAGDETPVYRFANALSGEDDFSNLIHVANLAQSGDQTLYLTATITGVLTPIEGTEQAVEGYTYYNASKVELETQPTVGDDVTGGYKSQDATSGAALIRVAVYEVNGSTYTYKGLLGKTAGSNNTAEGAITATTASNTLLTASTTTELNLGTIAAQQDKAYAVYVWLDGELFDEAKSGKSAQVELNFSTAKVSDGAVTEINGPQQQNG